MTLEIITSVMRIVIIIMTGILLPMIRRWISNRTEYDKYNRIKEWAYTAVWAAEQIHNKAEHDDPEGTLRRKYAKEAIKCMADKCGLELSESEINAMIECAVHELNGCRMPVTTEITAPENNMREVAENAKWY